MPHKAINRKLNHFMIDFMELIDSSCCIKSILLKFELFSRKTLNTFLDVFHNLIFFTYNLKKNQIESITQICQNLFTIVK